MQVLGEAAAACRDCQCQLGTRRVTLGTGLSSPGDHAWPRLVCRVPEERPLGSTGLYRGPTALVKAAHPMGWWSCCFSERRVWAGVQGCLRRGAAAAGYRLPMNDPAGQGGPAACCSLCIKGG